MLAMMAPKFVTSRVIQFSHFAEAMSIELLKQPFGSHLDYFMSIDSKHFYVPCMDNTRKLSSMGISVPEASLVTS